MVPIGLRQIVFLKKLQRLEWSGQGQNKNIAIKLIFKLGIKIRTLGTKIIQWVGHLWTRLLLVQTRPTEQRHQFNQFLSVQKRQTPLHEHNQRSCQHDQRSRQHYQRILRSKKEKSTYQQTHSQTHHCQTHHRANIFCWVIAITVNPKEKMWYREK